MTTRRKRHLAAAILVSGALTMTAACSSGHTNSDGSKPSAGGSSSASASAPAAPVATSISVGTAEDSNGPALAPEGSKAGGTVTMIDRDDFSHLDPGRIYMNYNSTVSLLFTRQLTGYKKTPDGTKLVGDLATDTGTTSDGGKTWTFTLKDGLKWEDGSAITSDDIKYSIERLYAPFIQEGPKYIQQWLSGNEYQKVYEGPYKGKSLGAVETPDKKTVVFKFKEAHPDANFTLAMTGYGVVPKAHDTKEAYDKKPFSSGPYKISSHITDKSLDLERNPNWDPKTDPIRNAFPDKWHMQFGVQAEESTNRFIADNGTDKTTMTFHNGVEPTKITEVLGNASLKPRLLQGLTPYVDYYYINNTRISDVNVRKALITAFPLQQIRLAEGGPTAGDFATTMMSPTVLGYEQFDVYGKLQKPEGDPEAAKKLLEQAGKTGQTIVYAYNNTPTQQKVTEVIRQALEKAGFKFVSKPLDPKNYYDQTGKLNNSYDVYWGGWGADWPTGQTALQPVWDGRQIGDLASNYAHFADKAIDKAMDDAAKIADAAEQGKAWAAIDKQINEQAASIPYIYDKYLGLYGSGLGGVEFDPLSGEQSPLNVFIK
ncbi:ABC transporter substrate-binding protein [Peterkaempfera bronchialis]|uniref:ABC transporter substrate-binding protein n=1 Tax=Peterkaempfera bronchialis TaxID=2126346 RepID=A0A345SZX6_9ACTN|nr:ABC transporter substrate-binding protein [Peterkaempfera bronchialis]AXI79281.1 ABC transporter substrate-binding protein [Peterkaempfera bronchialis]